MTDAINKRVEFIPANKVMEIAVEAEKSIEAAYRRGFHHGFRSATKIKPEYWSEIYDVALPNWRQKNDVHVFALPPTESLPKKYYKGEQ